MGEKKAGDIACFFLRVIQRLQRYDVLSLWAFLTLRDRELNALAFSQSFEARARDGTEVCENVWARLLLDKTKTFGFVEPFYGASNGIRHN
jgi:hypothetical protein